MGATASSPSSFGEDSIVLWIQEPFFTGADANIFSLRPMPSVLRGYTVATSDWEDMIVEIAQTTKLLDERRVIWASYVVLFFTVIAFSATKAVPYLLMPIAFISMSPIVLIPAAFLSMVPVVMVPASMIPIVLFPAVFLPTLPRSMIPLALIPASLIPLALLSMVPVRMVPRALVPVAIIPSLFLGALPVVLLLVMGPAMIIYKHWLAATFSVALIPLSFLIIIPAVRYCRHRNLVQDERIHRIVAARGPLFARAGLTIKYETKHTGMRKPKQSRTHRALVLRPATLDFGSDLDTSPRHWMDDPEPVIGFPIAHPSPGVAWDGPAPLNIPSPAGVASDALPGQVAGQQQVLRFDQSMTPVDPSPGDGNPELQEIQPYTPYPTLMEIGISSQRPPRRASTVDELRDNVASLGLRLERTLRARLPRNDVVPALGVPAEREAAGASASSPLGVPVGPQNHSEELSVSEVPSETTISISSITVSPQQSGGTGAQDGAMSPTVVPDISA